MNLPDSNPESRMWAALSHVSALSGFVIPFGNIVGPLIIWLVKRDEMSFVDARPSAATVTAVAPSLLLSIPHEQLAIKLEGDEGFAARFYRAIAMFLSSRLRTAVVQFDSADEPIHQEE